jgi:excisionase family DNA binding protein
MIAMYRDVHPEHRALLEAEYKKVAGSSLKLVFEARITTALQSQPRGVCELSSSDDNVSRVKQGTYIRQGFSQTARRYRGMTPEVYPMPAKAKSVSRSRAALIAAPNHTTLSATEPPLITKEELAKDLRVGCRTIEAYVAERRIPFVKLGHRTLRFCLDDVRRALRLHWTVKEVQ